MATTRTTITVITAMTHPAHESPAVMLIPLAVLAFGATFAGVFYRHWFIGTGFEGFWKESIFLAKDNTILEDMEHVPWLVSLLPFLMMVGGFYVAYRMYVVDKTLPDRLASANPLLYKFLYNKWYFDEALRLPVRAPGLLDRPPVLEGRRRPDHRRHRA